MSDRTVHASNNALEVVRYDRAGKWFIEPVDKSLPRQSVTIAQAVDMAMHLWNDGGTVHFDRPGGNLFNKRVRDRCG